MKKKVLLGLSLATFAGVAAAGDLDGTHEYGPGDYAVQAFYRVDFGGTHSQAQSVGLRLDNQNAQAHGAPAVFLASFGGQGLGKVAVNGVDLRGLALSANQAEGGGFFSALTVTQWVALGLTAVIATDVAVDATDEDNPKGTGGS